MVDDQEDGSSTDKSIEQKGKMPDKSQMRCLVNGMKQNVFGQCKLLLKMINQIECIICFRKEGQD